MAIEVFQSGHMLSFSHPEQWTLTGGIAARLLAAALLGSIVGIDREIHHKASGLRTNLLICVGAALFTFLSALVAGENSTNKGQIASNIVQGIGFLGAGLILHNRSRVLGLTSAATVWVVASIGMACGAGLYAPAIYATILVLVVLEAVGFFERTTNLKLYARVYEVRGKDLVELERAVLKAMDREQRRLTEVEHDSIGSLQRLWFSVQASSRGHDELARILRGEAGIEEVLTFRDWEEE
jgi:putative Mg2+ transporter-C (MgtC) family protein